jgi:hypothetical protein
VHPAHWRRTFPPREVNNIYFDTADYVGLNANLAGVAERAKLRCRWYGPDLPRIAKGQLELKRKAGTAGWKEIVRLGQDFDLEATAWSHFDKALRGSAWDHVPDWLARFPLPVLINSYHREYYATPDGAVRLTIDTRLRAFDQRSCARPNLSRLARVGDSAVLELKASVEPEPMRQLSAAVSCFPVRADRFSKYVRGLMAAPDL